MRLRSLAALSLALCALGPAASTPARSVDSGSIVVLDAATGRELAHLSANGAVVTSIADGRGGWFVGGSFTRLGGQHRVAVAHLMASGTVDPNWHALIGSASGRPVAVYALARAGARLFVGGRFGLVYGLQRGGLAALGTRSGAVMRNWAPVPRGWPDVAALAVAGKRLLVARQWNYPVPGITALGTDTARVDRDWNPHLLLIGDAGNFSSLQPLGRRVYVAGSFRVAGLRRNGLVAVDARDGRPDRRWAPEAQNCSVCNGFAVLYGLAPSRRRIYVSGDFGSINGVARDGVAALDPLTGTTERGWAPARGGNDVLRLALAGSRLYLGGLSGLWALDARTGAAIRLPPNHGPGQSLALAVSGRRLLVGGRT